MAKLFGFTFKNWDCHIVEKKKIWFSISLGIILVGLILFFIFGFNVGIDFSGGTILNVTTGSLYTDASYDGLVAEVNKVLNANGVNAEITQKLSSDSAPGVSIRYQNVVNGKDATEDKMFEVNNKIKAELETKIADYVKGYSNASANVVMESVNVNMSNVGATASSELLLKAFLSIAVAAALILVYVAIRFEILSGVAAVIALIHDLLVMSAFMIIFRIQVNSSFVAALITILGYSINNTIVLFDRVRENEKGYLLRDASPTELINTSVKDTLTRSINTTITTLITIVLLAIFGLSQMREFAMPIIFGLLAGAYSSVFVAPCLWAWMKEKSLAKKSAKKRTYKNLLEKETKSK